MTDHELMARLAAGDDSALEELLARHRGPALRLAGSILHDDALAEDVVQEAFARVYLLRHRYQPTFTFTAYLSAMVRNLCITQLRRLRSRPAFPQEWAEKEADSAEAAYLRRESRIRLWDALRALDERDRLLLTGYALEGLSYRELAARLHISLPQVKIRLHRIRKRLKEREEP